jgi:hypothetical protein
MSSNKLRGCLRLGIDSGNLDLDRPDPGTPIAITYVTETQEGNGLHV